MHYATSCYIFLLKFCSRSGNTIDFTLNIDNTDASDITGVRRDVAMALVEGISEGGIGLNITEDSLQFDDGKHIQL